MSQVEQSVVYAREGRHDVSATFLAKHDMLLRRSRLTSTLHSGPDREYKAVAALDSLTVRVSNIVSYCKS